MDAIDTGGGAAVGDVKAGRDFVGRDRRSQQDNDSHDIIIKLDETHKDLASLQSKILEMMVDIKFFQNLSQERGIQLAQIDNKVEAMEKAIIDLNSRVWWMDKGVFLMSVVFIVFLFSLWR